MRAIARTFGVLGFAWAFAAVIPGAHAADPSSFTPDWMPWTGETTQVAFFDNAAFQPSSYSDSLGNLFADDGEPSFCVSVGALFLQRSRPNPAIVASGPGGVGTVIDAGSFDFGWDTGPEFIITHKADNGLIWEGRYFNDRSASATHHVENITNFRIAGIGVTILGGGDLDSIYKTQLDSSELNVHVPINDSSTFLVGFRWVELHDQLRVHMTSPTVNAIWDENNHLYGAQAGLTKSLLDPDSPLQFNGIVKAGVYGNVMDSRFSSTIVGGASDSATDAAFVGEVGINSIYHFNDNVAIRGGYMVLWLENVALAGDTASTTTQIAGGSSSPINTDGLWYHGATMALEVMW